LAPRHGHGYWQIRLLTRIIPVPDLAMRRARETTVAAAHTHDRPKTGERGKI